MLCPCMAWTIPAAPRVEGPWSAEPSAAEPVAEAQEGAAPQLCPFPIPGAAKAWAAEELILHGMPRSTQRIPPSSPHSTARQSRAGPVPQFPLTAPGMESQRPSSPWKGGAGGAWSRAGSTRRRRAPAWVAGLYKPGLDEAQAQALLPDSHPEMPREQPRLGYCRTSLLPSPAKEKQQEKHLTSPLPVLGLLDGGTPVGIWDWDGQRVHPCLSLPSRVRPV